MDTEKWKEYEGESLTMGGGIKVEKIVCSSKREVYGLFKSLKDGDYQVFDGEQVVLGGGQTNKINM